jgi:hypothetical protein
MIEACKWLVPLDCHRFWCLGFPQESLVAGVRSWSMTDRPSAHLDDLPLDVLKKLMKLADQLPEESRGQFLEGVTTRIAGVLRDHPRTLVYSALGFVVGHVLDQVLTLHVPFAEAAVHLTGDRLGPVGGVTGAVLGFWKDIKGQAARERIAAALSDELHLVLARGR